MSVRALCQLRDKSQILESVNHHLEKKQYSLSDLCDDEGNTPIHLLCMKFPIREDVIELFIDIGVDVNAKNQKNETALHSICKSVNGYIVDVVKLLMKHNICLSQQDADGRFAVEVLCRNHVSTSFDELIGLLSVGGLRSRCVLELCSNENVMGWRKNIGDSCMSLKKQLLILEKHGVKFEREDFYVLEMKEFENEKFENEKQVYCEIFMRQASQKC